MNRLLRSLSILVVFLAAGLTSAQETTPLSKRFPGTPILAPDGGCFHPGMQTGVSTRAMCSTGVVVPPSGWFSGDTHEHAQLCFTPSLKTEGELRDEMIARGQNVSSVLVWGVRLNQALYLSSFLPRITGTEDPSTVGYPSQIIQYGIETSGFQCANLGHTIALNVDPAQANFFIFGGCPNSIDQSGDYAAPVVDYFKLNGKAVVGYAHQTWPVPLYSQAGLGGFDWENSVLPAYVGADARCSFGKDLAFPDPTTITIHPTLAAHDVATGRLDFLECVDLYSDLSTTSSFEDRWYGLYYKLLNAGQQVSIVGGTDADCVLIRQTACEPQTWVQLEDGQALDYDAWTEGIDAGRTSISDGGAQFLEIEVGGQSPGGQVYVSRGGAGNSVNVTAKVRFHLAAGTRHSDTIEIVQNGVVVQSQLTGQRKGGVFEINKTIPFQKSGWIAARTKSGSAHTGAVSVFVDLKPIANCADAEYFTIYSDYLNWMFDLAASFPDPSILQAWVGCSDPEIRDHIAAGRRVFAAVRDYAAGPPQDVTRLGWSTPSGRGPSAIGIDAKPTAGTTVHLNCFNAPPNALGALLVSPWFNAFTPDIVFGARLFVLGLPQGVPFVAYPTRSTAGGFTNLPLPLPAVLAGYDLYAQYLWYNTPGYDQMSIFSSSDALELKVR